MRGLAACEPPPPGPSHHPLDIRHWEPPFSRHPSILQTFATGAFLPHAWGASTTRLERLYHAWGVSTTRLGRLYHTLGASLPHAWATAWVDSPRDSLGDREPTSSRYSSLGAAFLETFVAGSCHPRDSLRDSTRASLGGNPRDSLGDSQRAAWETARGTACVTAWVSGWHHPVDIRLWEAPSSRQSG